MSDQTEPTKKITRKEYEDQKAALEKQLEKVRLKLAQKAQAKTEDWASLDEEALAMASDEWNSLHDQEYDIAGSLDDLEHDWHTRDWTRSEWVQWGYMCNNVD